MRQSLLSLFTNKLSRERNGSFVECLTGDQGVVGSSLASVTVLCP